MAERSGPTPVGGPPGPPRPQAAGRTELTPAQKRARRISLYGTLAALVLLVVVAMFVRVLVRDGIRTAMAGDGPNESATTLGLLRDAVIVIVGFEVFVVSLALIFISLQVLSLIVLFRDEIGPLLESAREAVADVRGTTSLVSSQVVSPLMKWSGYAAGLRRILRKIGGLREPDE